MSKTTLGQFGNSWRSQGRQTLDAGATSRSPISCEIGYILVPDAFVDAPIDKVPPVLAGTGSPDDAGAMDKSILNYATLNGALELLPQSLATMAIIPLQMVRGG